MSDLIDRQDAIDAIRKHEKDSITENLKYYNHGLLDAEMAVLDLPSAEPERLTDDDFETIRIHLNAHKEELCNQGRWEEAEDYQRILDRFMAFASAEPECNLDEWCHDCKEYDNDKHCCPRWNRVIRTALEEAQPERKRGRWINDRLVTTNGGTYAVRRCPFCESYYQDVGYGWDYCPICGARLEE